MKPVIPGSEGTKQSLFVCLGSVPLEKNEIAQSHLDIQIENRSNLFQWNGQFSPQLVEVLLDRYARTNSVVLDPFAGSGTVLYESARKGLSSIASEINPVAYCMARTYELVNLRMEQRWQILARFEESLFKTLPDELPLFLGPENRKGGTGKVKQFCKELVDDPAVQGLFETVVVLSDFYEGSLAHKSLVASWKKLKSITKWLPYSARRIRVFNCDGRSLPLQQGQVNLVITSPPYINVHNYHQQARTAAEELGWDLLTVAKSEIGSNRKFRGNRFLTVIQYCLDITLVLNELVRVCNDSSRLIFVVGRQSSVRGTPFYNGEIVARLATRAVGLELTIRQERSFRNKFGSNIFEDILHFNKLPHPFGESLHKARLIAAELLEAAYALAPKDAHGDIKSAIANVETVRPSPRYDAVAARTTRLRAAAKELL